MQITCCGCNQEKVEARLTNGEEIYPHREDLYDLPFWKCDTCDNFVGCHHKTSNRTQPLGCIPTKELRKMRSIIHRMLDPLWKYGNHKRKDVYGWLSNSTGKPYHTANLCSIEDCEEIIKLLAEFRETYVDEYKKTCSYPNR